MFIAKQVPVDWQQSYIDENWGEFEDCFITGNNDFKSLIIKKYSDIIKSLYDAEADYSYIYTITEALDYNGIIQELSDAIDVDVSEIKLQKFTGYVSTPTWDEVTPD